MALIPKRTRLSARPIRVRPEVEILESRLVPYSVSGNAWPHPQLFTISFVADGTFLGSGKYVLSFNLGTGSLRAVSFRNTQMQNANPLSSGGGMTDFTSTEQGPGGWVGDVFDPTEKPAAGAATIAPTILPTLANAPPSNSFSLQTVAGLVAAARGQAALEDAIGIPGTITPTAPLNSVPLSANRGAVQSQDGHTAGDSTDPKSLLTPEEQTNSTAPLKNSKPPLLDAADAPAQEADLEIDVTVAQWLEARNLCLAEKGMLLEPKIEFSVAALPEADEGPTGIPALALAALAVSPSGFLNVPWAETPERNKLAVPVAVQL
jgi:hypothetical protein